LIQIHTIENELKSYSEKLCEMDRWLVLNKIDALTEEQVDVTSAGIIDKLESKIPCYSISAVSGKGCKKLLYAIEKWLLMHPNNLDKKQSIDDE
jgi:GTP-binding protein